MAMILKEYIKARSAFNLRELAKLIDWSPSSFHQWLNDKRPIPGEKAKLLGL
jgi:phage antirepressor YoqD-like protein